MAAKRPSTATLWLTIVAAPIALAFETLLRKLIFPPEFEIVREVLSPPLTILASVLDGVAVIAALAGLSLQRRVAQRRFARLPDPNDVDARYRETFGVFLLTASLPQIPALLSTFAYMFGASIWPVLVGVGVCSVGVVTQALRVRSIAEAGS